MHHFFTKALPRLAFLISSISLLGPVSNAQTLTIQWDRTYGGSGSDIATIFKPTSDGGYIVGGFSGSSASGDKSQVGQGFNDYWVVKLDAAGNKVWDRSVGGSREDGLVSLQQTSDGGYILGGSSFSPISGDKTQDTKGFSDYWLVKLDANGNKLWDIDLGGDKQDILASVYQTPDGGYIVSGTSDSNTSVDKSQPASFGAGFWIVKLDATGTKIWDRTFSSYDAELGQLIPTADGGFLLGGTTSIGIQGDKTQPTQGVDDYWVIKLDSQGNKLWDRDLGGSDSERLQSLVQTSDGGYLIGGSSGSPISGDKTQANRGVRSSQDYWVIKLDAAGTKLWDQTLGGSEDDELATMYPTADGGALLGGNSLSGISGEKTQAALGNYDAWLVKLNANGTKQWDGAFGGTRYETLRSVMQASDGSLLLGTGSSSGAGGNKTQPSRGQEDYWLLKVTARVMAVTTPTSASFGVYPNPANTHFTLTLPANAPRQQLHLRLLDATGRVVVQQLIPVVGPNTPIYIARQTPGIYLLRLEGPDSYRASQRLQLQ